MISLVDMRPAWGRPTGAQQRRLPLRQEHLAEIIDPAKNLDDPIQHHRLRHSAMAAYLNKPFSHNPLIARKLPIRVHLDWFHIAMRLTGLGQYAKGLAHYNPIEAAALQDRLERIKWRLWHGDADEALTRVRELAEDVAALASGYPGLARLVKATAGVATYIGNNVAAIADYAERWDHGEIISTAFAESTVDLVVSRRFAKKQQMQWSEKRTHLLPKTRTRTLDGRCTTCSPA